MSSLKVYKQPELIIPDFGGDSCVAVVFQHADFSGWNAVFGVGGHDMTNFETKGGKNDDASSLKVRGLDCKVTLHENADYSGWEAGPFEEGDYNLKALKKDKGFKNDEVSSLKVFKQPKIVVSDFGAPDC